NVPPEYAARMKAQGVALNTATPPSRNRNRARNQPQQPLSQIRLDISVDSPNQFYVRGQGIDAEMQGQLHIGGTTSTPDIDGAFKMRRGQISEFGQRLAVEYGNISFDGGLMDPRLDFLASTRAGDVTAYIQV